MTVRSTVVAAQAAGAQATAGPHVLHALTGAVAQGAGRQRFRCLPQSPAFASVTKSVTANAGNNIKILRIRIPPQTFMM